MDLQLLLKNETLTFHKVRLIGLKEAIAHLRKAIHPTVPLTHLHLLTQLSKTGTCAFDPLL